MNKQTINRVGESCFNKYGNKMWISEYISAKNITVEFENGHISKNRYYKDFKNKEIVSPKCKKVLGIGYLDTEEKCVDSKFYRIWYDMINRCYNTKSNTKSFNSYKNVTVDADWHSFKSFSLWCMDNWYDIDGVTMHLDKDILTKDSSMYSSKNCMFVPNTINCMFVGLYTNKERKLPKGVYHCNKEKTYIVICSDENKRHKVGVYETVEEAEYQYKKYKEFLIKKQADKFKDYLPKHVYEALYKFKV